MKKFTVLLETQCLYTGIPCFVELCYIAFYRCSVFFNKLEVRPSPGQKITIHFFFFLLYCFGPKPADLRVVPFCGIEGLTKVPLT